MYFCLIGILIFLFGIVNPVLAIFDPLSFPNNKYGIHIIQPTDIPDAEKLVNSSGGAWGYVTFVIPESDRNSGKWQTVFDDLRRRKLIPLVRIATRIEKDGWVKPEEKTIPDWVSFLETLHWPIQNRYVMLYNEPNHAKEWGGTIDPEGYTTFAAKLAKALKNTSPDYFILPAALDVSADGKNGTMDAATFLHRGIQTDRSFYSDLIDGWNAHAYPNPAFSGTPYESGRGTLRSYQWELAFLANQGITKTFPVFISETGWEHSNGQTYNPKKRNPLQIASFLEIASELVWNDQRIVAITPFILRYQEYPFDHFSWMKTESTDYHPMFETYQNIPKQKGRPKQRQSYEITDKFIPKALVRNRLYTFSTVLKNTGQNILDATDGYSFDIIDDKKSLFFAVNKVPKLEPGQSGPLVVQFETPTTPDTHELSFVVQRDTERTLVGQSTLSVVPPPGLAINAQLAWKTQSSLPKVTVLVYELPGQHLVHKFTAVSLTDGLIKVDDLESIIPDETYRVVILAPKYLPQQVILPLQKNITDIVLPRLIPGDFDEDGKLSLGDLLAAVKLDPHTAWQLFFGP